jgi:(2Fe-2S) ferredoxin
VNDRKGERKSCEDGQGQEIRKRLKAAAKKRWKPNQVRVSQSLCMNLCEQGPNVIIYPRQIWFSKVGLDDIDRILEEIENIVEG